MCCVQRANPANYMPRRSITEQKFNTQGGGFTFRPRDVIALSFTSATLLKCMDCCRASLIPTSEEKHGRLLTL